MVLRPGYDADLEQLRLQVELMGLRVEENLVRMHHVLQTGDMAMAEAAVAADDGIDAMNVSLTDRCTTLLARQQPVASDLRLVLSVIRLTAEIERVGDLSLRIVRKAPEHALLTSSPTTFDILLVMADTAIEAYRAAMNAWSTSSLAAAEGVAEGNPIMSHLTERLVRELARCDLEHAVPVALASYVAGQALDRIADHAGVIGARVRYQLTGDPTHLAAEVR